MKARCSLVAVAALLLSASPAFATATIGRFGGVITYVGDAGNNTIFLTGTDSGNTDYWFQTSQPPAAPTEPLTDSDGGNDCAVTRGFGTMDCFINGTTSMDFRLGDGEDRINVSFSRVGNFIDGEGGNDPLLEGSNDAAAVDRIEGGPGDDRLSDFGGNDSLFGEEGNDEFYLGAGTDAADGGSGADQVNFWFMPPDRPLKISMSRVEDSMAPGGAQVDTISNMERVYGGDGSDEITGDDNANELDGGDGGNDKIIGGGGVDNIKGGAGDDEIFARDGQIDVIDCGFGGTDVVHGDSNDSISNCETQHLSDELIPDADGDGSRKPADCDDRDAAVKPGNPEIVNNGKDDDCSRGDAKDADRDGASTDVDCADNDARRTPGKRDIRGNGIDENCDGRDAAASKVTSPIANRWGYAQTFTIVVELKIKSLVRGMTVKVKCKGRGCPKKSKTFKVKGSNPLDLKRGFFGRARLKPGAVVEIQILRPEFHGKVVRYTVRAGKLPSKKDLCLKLGARKPTRSC